MKVQEKPVKNTIDVSLYVAWLQRHQHLKHAGKMAQKMIHLTVIETLSKRGQQKQQQFHTHEELFSGQPEVAGNKCRAGIFPEYSTLQ